MDDQPAAPFAPGDYDYFTTSLVGVLPFNSGGVQDSEVLYTFRWKSNYNKANDSGGASIIQADQGLIDDGDGTGGVTVLDQDIPSSRLTQPELRAMQHAGVLGLLIPEPQTWVLMILGFGFCGALSRKSRSMQSKRSYSV